MPADEGRSAWTRPAFVGSAVLLLALLILVVWLLARGDGAPADPGTAAPGSATAAPSAGRESPTTGPTGTARAAPGRSVCGLTEEADSGTLTRAPAATWQLVGTVAAPSVEGQGPGEDDDGLRTCYARTPTGALLAAANVAAMGSSPQLIGRMTEEMTAEGPGRDAALKYLEAGAAPEIPTGVRYQIRGFRLLDYTGTEASVDLALGVDGGLTGSFVLDLRWEDGDWKVVLTDDGGLGSLPAPVPDLTGYTLWSGA
ncbi:hypothetical protein ATJ97_1944 [Georgenia soli]|uniref:DUF8175 domain-containing protein n=1 Tax=Georgenia soli TaxID=638953 RepID=A0A2A9EKK9_9MICO|nr:hypothetical protein [Georgenia soli]PFG39438.1 hypothetical protein ATJ97_1944 [Georgenia soli]